jgi:multidrug efflux system outer membrane protein
MKLNYSRVILLFLVATILSCAPTSQSLETGARPLPAQFSAATDSSNSIENSPNWRTFFQDKYLVSLIDSALESNFDRSIALQRIQAVKSDLILTKGELLPSVTANVSSNLRRFGLYTMDGAGSITTDITPGLIVPIHLPDYYIGVQTSWEVDVWGKLKNRRKSAVARVLASTEGRNLITTELVAELANLYYELLALDKMSSVVAKTSKIQEDALEVVRVQKNAAAGTELAVEQFEAGLFNLQALHQNVLLNIAQAENRINQLIGRYPQRIARDTAAFTSESFTPYQIGVPSSMLRNRPDIRQAEMELLASKADVASARAAFYPSLTITGAAGFQAFSTKYLFRTPESFAYGLFGDIVGPLVNRSALQAEFKRADAGQREALLQYQKTIFSGFSEVYAEMVRLENLKKIEVLKVKESDVFNRSIKTSTELYRAGRATYVEVLLAQQNALQASLDLIDTRKTQYQASVNLYKALGGGWR